MRTNPRSKRKVTKPKVKAGKIPKMGWGQYGKNASTIRRLKKAFDDEKGVYIEKESDNA